MIFSKLKSELVNQVGDKIRLDASKTFEQGTEIFSVEIMPEVGADYISLDLSKDFVLDWVYATPGIKTATLRVNGDDLALVTIEINVLTEIEDKLFSNDSDIDPIESDISYYYKQGRNSHLDMHRVAQNDILEELYDRGVKDSEGNKLTKANILQTDELKAWSKYLVLYLIYKDQKKSVDDAITEKMNLYRGLATKASQNKKFLKIDTDLDGKSETINTNLESATIRRR